MSSLVMAAGAAAAGGVPDLDRRRWWRPALLGIGYGVYMAVDTALVTEVLPVAADRGKDLGIVNIANAAPQVLAPALAAPVVDGLGGYPVLYGLTAVVTRGRRGAGAADPVGALKLRTGYGGGPAPTGRRWGHDTRERARRPRTPALAGRHRARRRPDRRGHRAGPGRRHLPAERRRRRAGRGGPYHHPQRRVRRLAVPSIPRVISRPSADAADRANDFAAEDPSTLLNNPPRAPLSSCSGSGRCDCRGPGPGFGCTGAGGGASFAASRSYAESRSTVCPYSPCNGDPATAAVTVAGSAGAIRDRGARTIVHATGVGAPRSDITVTIASPVPSEVSASSSA